MALDVGNLLIGQSELGEQTMRALELKGDLPQLVDPRYQLGINVDDWTLPEYRWLRRQLRCVYPMDSIAGAGTNVIQWRLPSGGPRALVVLERMLLTNSTAAVHDYQFYFTTTSVASFVSGAMAVDDRQKAVIANPIGNGMLICGLINTGAPPTGPGAGTCIVSIPASTTIEIKLDWILTQGLDAGNSLPYIFTVAGTVAALPMRAVLFTRERALLDAER
jgi:hypothetical protein